MRTGQADANRPLFLRTLGREWLPAVPDVHERLTAGGRVADVGCGEGWSSIGMALAYPRTRVDGYDVDDARVRGRDRARRVVRRGGPGPLPPPRRRATTEETGYDLVSAFECVHDMPHPVGVLAGMRRMAAPEGCVLVMDERVPESFTGPGDPVEQLMYGMSMLICLPDSMSTPGSRGDGDGDAAEHAARLRARRPGSRGSRCCRSRTTCSASTGCSREPVDPRVNVR